MKFQFSRIAAGFFAVAGLCFGGLALLLRSSAGDALPVLLKAPEAIQPQVCAMMDRVCAGDYEGASALMLGTPSLGAHREPQELGGKLLWQAHIDSLSYELEGDCYVTEDGISQDLRITSLDLDHVTESLGQRTGENLQAAMEAAEKMSQIYDETNEFQGHVVQTAYLKAFLQALEEDSTLTSETVTVRLTFQDGQWWILPDAELIQAISGGILE